MFLKIKIKKVFHWVQSAVGALFKLIFLPFLCIIPSSYPHPVLVFSSYYCLHLPSSFLSTPSSPDSRQQPGEMSWLVAFIIGFAFAVYYILHSNCHSPTCPRCEEQQQQQQNSQPVPKEATNTAQSPNNGEQRSTATGRMVSPCPSLGRINLVDIYPNEAVLPIKSDLFRTYMQLCTEFAIDYHGKNEFLYNVTSDHSPGFLTKKMPSEMPFKPEKFSAVLDDIYHHILPGITHWQHPRFHGYFPHGCCYPDIIGEVLVSSIGVVQFSWDSSPALTELEVVMVNWIGRAIGLPDSFLFNVDSPDDRAGGGALEPSSSDAIFVVMLAARDKKLAELVGDRKKEPDYQAKAGCILPLLVAYASAEAHSGVEKASRLVMVNFRVVETESKYQMTGRKLEAEIWKDRERGLIPFFVCATSGTTSVASFDKLDEIADVAKEYDLWMHVDGAYGVSARICPEYRHLMAGIERSDSINMNAHKLLLASCASSILWTRRQKDLRAAYTFNGEYLRKSKKDAMDFRHWGISLSRRAKALKLWVLFRLYGLSGLQEYIRRLVRLASRFAYYLHGYKKIEVVTHCLSLVTFRVVADDDAEANKLTAALCEHINRSRKILATFAKPKGGAVIRISINHERSTNDDIDKSWNVLKRLMDSFFGLDTVVNHRVATPETGPYRGDEGLVASPITEQSTESASSSSVISSMSQQALTSSHFGYGGQQQGSQFAGRYDQENGGNYEHANTPPNSPK